MSRNSTAILDNGAMAAKLPATQDPQQLQGDSPTQRDSTAQADSVQSEQWRALNVGLQALGRVARTVGQTAKELAKALDPDLLRHATQLPLMGLVQLGPSRAPIVPLPDDGARPVLFLHGLGGHRSNFAPMRAWFRLHGRSRTYSLGLDTKGTVEQMAAELQNVIAEVLACNRLPEGAQVDIVAHSMGGIVARLALQDPQTAARVAQVVTLGTPHAGTQAARFARTPHVRELRPNSPVMQALAVQVPWPQHLPPLTAFWSPSDLLLLPALTGAMEGARNVEMTGFTHYSYLLDLRSAREVWNVLT